MLQVSMFHIFSFHLLVSYIISPTSLFLYHLSVTHSISTEYTQKNGAVSKVNKKLISHLTWAQPTPSATAAFQVSHALPAVRFSCLLRGRGASFQDGVAAGKGFLCAPFWGVQICYYSARNSRCTVITDLDISKRSTQKTFSCCDAILETGPTAPQ